MTARSHSRKVRPVGSKPEESYAPRSQPPRTVRSLMKLISQRSLPTFLPMINDEIFLSYCRIGSVDNKVEKEICGADIASEVSMPATKSGSESTTNEPTHKKYLVWSEMRSKNVRKKLRGFTSDMCEQVFLTFFREAQKCLEAPFLPI